MKYLTFLFLFTITSCITINHDTRYKIESFRVIHYDTTEGTVKIKFDVRYHSSDKDSGYQSLEKGLNGSDDKILYFGIIDDTIPIYRRCKDLNFQEFIDGFNSKDREFIGQRFDFSYKFCVPPQYIKANGEIILVLENQDTKIIDTLKSSIW